MKKLQPTLRHLLLTGLLPLLAFASCIKEDIGNTPKGSANVTFSLMLPGSSTPSSRAATRALTDIQENHVQSIDILMFEYDNGSGNGKFVDVARATGTSIGSDNTDGATSRKKTFSVIMRQGRYDLVILANAREFIDRQSLTGTYKKAALASLETASGWQGKWPADNSRPIPMWGYKDNVTISESTDLTGSNALSMTRMVARVDVSVNTAQVTNFQLTSVRVYNYNTRGAMVPANYWDTDYWNPTHQDGARVVVPTVPASSVLTEGPLLYTLSTDDKAANKYTQEIYLYESENHTATPHTNANKKGLLQRTCLVIGGKYGTDSDETFYRVDFSTGNGASQSYQDVLRNFWYTFRIDKVSGSGFADPDVAYRSEPVNIEANVLEWNDGSMANIVSDGQYMLSVSPGEFSFSRDAWDAKDEKNSLSIFTDYNVSPNAGWTIEKIVDAADESQTATWLTVQDGTSGAANVKKNVWLKLEENDTPQERAAIVVVAAGRLRYKVKVLQTLTPDIGLSIINALNSKPITELVFSAAKDVAPDAQQFTVNWAPKAADLFVSTSTVGSNAAFVFGGFSDVVSGGTLPGGTGTKTYNIQPAALSTSDLASDPFKELSMKVDYTVSNGVTFESKTLFLRQMVYNMIPVVDAIYLMDGKSTHTFGVRANYQWTAEIVNKDLDGDGKEVIGNLLTTAGGPNTSAAGTPVQFSTVNDLANPQIYAGTAQIKIKSVVPGLYPDQTIDLNCVSGIPQEESNCYMVKPGGLPILIPVSRANSGVAGSIGANDAYTAELVWTDNAGGVKATSGKPAAAINDIIVAGKGDTGYILVLPGTQEGNSVIAVKVGGIIKWSWHIWMTEYTTSMYDNMYVPLETPDNTKSNNGFILMDRNLGALTGYTTNTLTDFSKAGLLYQWGRKDPTPTGVSGNAESTIYNSAGVGSTTMIIKTSGGSEALSIANPATYYTGLNMNNQSWGGTGSKAIHDPCPKGWRVPVNAVWAGVTKSVSWVKGYTWASVGYLPSTGGRDNSSGNLSRVGSNGTTSSGYYWSADLNGSQPRRLAFDGTNLESAGTSTKAMSMAVRCVRE